MNDENLVTPSASRARELGRLGGLATGVAKKKRKTLQDNIKAVMDLPLSFNQKAALRKRGVKPEDMPENMMALWAFSVVDTGIMTGDGKDISKIAELSGQHTPKKKIEIDDVSGPRKVINIISIQPKAIEENKPKLIEVKAKAIEGSTDETDNNA